MKTICIVIPYFGKWPEWFLLFLQSCLYNPSINWHFFTDCGEPPLFCPNVKYTHIRYPNYQQWIGKSLEIRFIGDPYKLCDLKPMIGFIHQQEIKKYDYFGFGDIDIIYGNLRKFITSEMLTKKLISTHDDRISGHFCLLKNNTEMRNAFRNIPEWKKLLETPEHIGLDESEFTRCFIRYRFIRHRKLPELIKRFSPQYRACCFKEQHSTVMSHKHLWIDGKPNYPDIWHWEKGRLTANGHEMMYLHFMNWKSGRWHHCNGIHEKTPWEQLNQLVQFEGLSKSFYISKYNGFTLKALSNVCGAPELN